ncbi:MAG: YbjN domain-containing protein [Treponema sp.]|nr:YbjN domain-containing protein [Treponema sp.]
MKRKTMCFCIVLMLTGITCLSAQMSKKQLQDMYVAYLTSEGYNPSVDKDGDVNFTAEGHKFYINVMADDLQSFQLVLTNFLDAGSDRVRAFEAASYATRTTRVVRVYMTSSNKIAIDAYIFIGKPEDFKLHLKRLISVILTARTDYLDRVGK